MGGGGGVERCRRGFTGTNYTSYSLRRFVGSYFKHTAILLAFAEYIILTVTLSVFACRDGAGFAL